MKTINVYFLSIDRSLSPEEQSCLWEILPYERRLRLTRTREDKHDQILCAYALLQRALQDHYRMTTLPRIQVAEGGKPFLPDHPDIHFSISHTDGAAACAVYSAPIGLDLEKERPAAASLMKHYRCADQRAFWELWVHREAVGKLHGQGFAKLIHWDGDLEKHIACLSLPMPEGYYAAIAADNIPDWTVHTLAVEDLFADQTRR